MRSLHFYLGALPLFHVKCRLHINQGCLIVKLGLPMIKNNSAWPHLAPALAEGGIASLGGTKMRSNAGGQWAKNDGSFISK